MKGGRAIHCGERVRVGVILAAVLQSGFGDGEMRIDDNGDVHRCGLRNSVILSLQRKSESACLGGSS